MQFSTFIAAAALSTLAFAEDSVFKLVTKSDNSDLNNKGLTSYHEGAGFSFVVIGTTPNGRDFRYATEDRSLFSGLDGSTDLTTPVIVDSGFVTVGNIAEPVDASFDADGLLSLNGTSHGFYGCKNIADPYNYSKNNYLLQFSAEGTPKTGSCVPVTVAKA